MHWSRLAVQGGKRLTLSPETCTIVRILVIEALANGKWPAEDQARLQDLAKRLDRYSRGTRK
ncbi:hypothetical protein [Dyella silvae]|uniref:hypothetical protein n=1 Tax=Dyella silvae TaxID=2994424 RepID=UPI0022640CE1|nr:hypothetical protein [Dyella silvae]